MKYLKDLQFSIYLKKMKYRVWMMQNKLNLVLILLMMMIHLKKKKSKKLSNFINKFQVLKNISDEIRYKGKLNKTKSS